ncbi:MAG TPA: helix-turn-helix transcriptional regulator [Spirochaetia bacterium]|nr:helix-turn-helix transcriptional regulator [Spirochaetia bacterium]
MQRKIPQPQDWNIERLTIGCSDTNPVEIDNFLYTEPQHFEFDMHYCLELGIVVDGQMDRYYRSVSRTYTSGEIWLCGMWEPHGWAVRHPPSNVIVFFLYPPLIARTFFQEAQELNWFAPFTAPVEERPIIPEKRRPEILSIATQVRETHFQSPSLRKVSLRLKIFELMGIILDCWNKKPAPSWHSPEQYDKIGTAMQLVFESSRFLTASQIAQACGLNRNTLSRLFTEYTGMSFAEFALRYRVSSAAEHLRETEDPIKAVAASWGFSDASHFFRSFVKFYGCSPSDYRKTARAAERRLLQSKNPVT